MPILVIMVAVSDILDRVPDLLSELSGLAVETAGKLDGADLLLRLGSHSIAVVAKRDSRAGSVSQAAKSARDAAKRAGPRVLALVVVPFMGDVGKRICKKEGVAFIDLSGNADIQARGLRVHVAGRPNRFVQRGRPPSVFAPKSSRISRLLLLDPKRWWRQAELSTNAELGRGYVSKICSRLEEDRFIERGPDGAVRPRDPDLLLEAWKSQYDFRRHDIQEGHVTSRSGQELVERLVKACDDLDLSYALTGLAAAWLLAPFAGYRLVAVYMARMPSEQLLARLKWHEEKRGANLWLVRPNDEGVFHGGESIQGMPCVSPAQTFLDLHAMPERWEEAAEHVRKERLQWR